MNATAPACPGQFQAMFEWIGNGIKCRLFPYNFLFPTEGDGVRGAWSDWSTCTLSCAGGTQSRTRQCDNAPPVAGGQNCPDFGIGGGDGHQDCNVDPCPGITENACYLIFPGPVLM